MKSLKDLPINSLLIQKTVMHLETKLTLWDIVPFYINEAYRQFLNYLSLISPKTFLQIFEKCAL